MIVGIAGTLVAAASGFQLVRRKYEEPRYERLTKDGEFEVRRYAPRVVAQTVVSGEEGAVTREGFRRLAGYIFGGNDGGDEIAMTTPVERRAEGTRIDMTTPVERTEGEDGWVITFTMPRERAREALPTPDDGRVTLRERPAETVAVRRFSGRADVAMRRRETEALREWMRAHGYEETGPPTLAQYDPPWVLGPFRRNEIQIPIDRS